MLRASARPNPLSTKPEFSSKSRYRMYNPRYLWLNSQIWFWQTWSTYFLKPSTTGNKLLSMTVSTSAPTSSSIWCRKTTRKGKKWKGLTKSGTIYRTFSSPKRRKLTSILNTGCPSSLSSRIKSFLSSNSPSFWQNKLGKLLKIYMSKLYSRFSQNGCKKFTSKNRKLSFWAPVREW